MYCLVAVFILYEYSYLSNLHTPITYQFYYTSVAHTTKGDGWVEIYKDNSHDIAYYTYPTDLGVSINSIVYINDSACQVTEISPNGFTIYSASNLQLPVNTLIYSGNSRDLVGFIQIQITPNTYYCDWT